MSKDRSKNHCTCGVTIPAEQLWCSDCSNTKPPDANPRSKEPHPEYEGHGNDGGTQEGWRN